MFQEIVPLNPCFIITKNLMLSLIDKETTGTKNLALFIWNIAPFMLLWCSVNTQSFLSMINQVLFHSLSMVNQEILKITKTFEWNSDFNI